MVEPFFETGWQTFPHDPVLATWLTHAKPAALAVLQDPAKADWRCGGTWFAGVNSLDNDPAGAIAASGPLSGTAVQFIARHLGQTPQWDKAQLSCVRPGYPQPSPDETPAAFAFRRDRDAAHVDGLLPIGPQKRRMIREPHAFVLGIPLTDCSPDASPLVVWQGSHRIIQQAFRAVLAPHPVAAWPDIDVTEAYHAARRRCFAECRRVVVHARPGSAYLVHRLALHGVAPWAAGATCPPEGRMIAYFRPEIAGGTEDWLNVP